MLLIFMGASCTGKSSIAESFKKAKDFQVISGKDYLRFAKNENEAWSILLGKLIEASKSQESSIIYVTTDITIIQKLQSIDHAVFILFTAGLEVIKERFAKRMNGNLPIPVGKMLEKQLMDWKIQKADMYVETDDSDLESLVNKIYETARSKYTL